jgi:site-specific DNA-methyltransferase (adenine-specific)
MRTLPDESIDHIFTDPPYIKAQYLQAYTTLANHAARLLRPSGFLYVYCPQYRLDEIFPMLMASGLRYYWIVSQLNLSETGMVYVRNAICLHKPILIFQKPPMKKCPLPFTDVIRGNKQKAYHIWQQDINDVLGLLCRFAVPGETVLDPFTGSGTTLLAAKLLGLNAIGFESNPDTFQVAQQRLQQEPLNLFDYAIDATGKSHEGISSRGYRPPSSTPPHLRVGTDECDRSTHRSRTEAP